LALKLSKKVLKIEKNQLNINKKISRFAETFLLDHFYWIKKYRKVFAEKN
jgi:hypothetical protein